MAPLQLPKESAPLPLTENGKDDVWVLAPPPPLEEDHTDTTSCSSSQDLAPRFIPITATTTSSSSSTPTATTASLNLPPSALKKNTSHKGGGRWKTLFLQRKKKRVRFQVNQEPTIILLSPPLLHEPPLSAAERKRLTWYNAVDIFNFQAAVDDLSRQLAKSPWPAVYEALYNEAAAAAAGNNSNNNHHSSSIDDKVLPRDWEAGWDCIGMERLVTDHILEASLAHRKLHRQHLLDTQASAPFNNANRLRQAVQQASLATSAVSTAWAISVAQMTRRMENAQALL